MLVVVIQHRFDLIRNRGESNAEWGERIGSAVQWCMTQFGGPGFVVEKDKDGLVIVGGYYSFSSVVFYFSEDNHALEFKMRWV